ncbi:30S ribosomal protein S21 [Candidatus Dependentiae bacterium]|nr:30S ribosomal protein S21 [Candidatus Dependentiae bacterium]
MAKKKFNIEIQVTGNLEKSLKQFKKKLEREGVSRDMKRQVYFEPPTQKKRKRLMRAVKNNLIKMYESQLS